MVTSRFRDGLIAEDWLITDLAERLLLARKRRPEPTSTILADRRRGAALFGAARPPARCAAGSRCTQWREVILPFDEALE